MNPPNFYKSCDIIEFLDPEEESEGRLLASLFAQNGVRFLFVDAATYPTIDALFKDVIPKIYQRNLSAKRNGEPLYAPEIHLSCHGCMDGIGWIDGSLIPWSKIADLLWQFSSAIGYTTAPQQNGAFAQQTSLMSLSLSCCFGSSAAGVLFASEPYPVGGFMAPSSAIYVRDCATFFLKYYTMHVLNPWNAPAKVQEILCEFMPKGPSGAVPIECFPAPLTPNTNYRSPHAI